MDRSTNPGIDIQDMMGRLRSEVESRHQNQQAIMSSNGNGQSNDSGGGGKTDLTELPAPPSREAIGSEALVPASEIKQLLQLAKEQTVVSPRVPRLFHRLFRKQGGFNKALMDALKLLLRSDRELLRGQREIKTWLEAQASWLDKVRDAEISRHEIAAKEVSMLNSKLLDLKSQQSETLDRVTVGEQITANINEKLQRHETELSRVAGQQLSAVEHIQSIREQHDRLAAHTRTLQGGHDGLGLHVNHLQAQADSHGQHLKNLQLHTDRAFEALSRFEGRQERLGSEVVALKSEHDRLGLHVNNLQAQADAFVERATEHLKNVQKQGDCQGEHLKNLQTQTDQFRDSVARLERRQDESAQQLGAHLNNLQAQADSQTQHLKNLQIQADGLRDQFGDARSESHTRVNELQNRVRAVSDDHAATGHHLNNLQVQADSQMQHLKNLQIQADALRDQFGDTRSESHAHGHQLGSIRSDLEEMRAAIVETKEQTRRTEERQTSEGTFLKSELHLVNRALHELRSTPGRSKPKAGGKVPVENLDDHELDALYVAFENQFRGSRELIKERVRIYLRDLKKAKVGQSARPILDVGCGRGEWLELLSENGLIAEGVDSNVFMIAECKERGLRVVEDDGVEYLRSLADHSCGAITGFHIIEHLPPRIMVQLFREAFRVLQPGGLAIFETPNPENILVGSNRFYSDPTHLRPLPKEYTSFVMSSVGFTHVEVRPLHPDKNSLPKDEDAPKLRKFINQHFFGEQDYAVIARK